MRDLCEVCQDMLGTDDDCVCEWCRRQREADEARLGHFAKPLRELDELIRRARRFVEIRT